MNSYHTPISVPADLDDLARRLAWLSRQLDALREDHTGYRNPSDVFNDVFTYPVIPRDGGVPCVGVEMYDPQPLPGFDPVTGDRFVRLLSPDDARVLAGEILRAADEARAA